MPPPPAFGTANSPLPACTPEHLVLYYSPRYGCTESEIRRNSRKMGNNKDAMRWLLSELPKLRQEGVLDEAHSDALAKYCHDELDLKPSPRRFIYTLFFIGAGMIVAGLVLLFYTFWYKFQRTQQLGICAIPAVLAFAVAMATILRQKNQAWREFSAMLSAVALGLLVAMPHQIYHTIGSWREIYALTILTARPFIYIFNRIALTTAYVFMLFGLCYWQNTQPLAGAFAAVGVLPMLHIHISRNSPDRVWSRYLMLLVAGFGLYYCGMNWYPALSSLALAGTMLYAGWTLLERNENYLRNPWLNVAFFSMLVLLAMASTDTRFFQIERGVSKGELWAYWLYTGAVLATNIRLFPKSRLDAKRLCTGLAVLLPLLHLCGVNAFAMKIIFNVYLGVYGAVLMLDGYRRARLLTYNGGIAMVLLLIVCRFFDTELSRLTRSIVFVAIGAVLIAANFIFFRRRFNEGR